MNLYLIMFDSVDDYVLAPSFADAILRWSEEMQRQHGEEWDDDQPESVTLVSDRPVIGAAVEGSTA